MKKVFFFIVFIFATANSFAQSAVYVSGYTTSKGTYVQPHYRTSPNSTRNDNYSTVGNVNPYTGATGTKSADAYSSTSSYIKSTYTTPSYSRSSNSSTTYSSPSYSTSTYTSSSNYSTTPIYTGSRGGQYYINSNGNKTYLSSN